MSWSKAGWLSDQGGWSKSAAGGDALITTNYLARTVTGGTVGAVLDGTHLAAIKTFLNGIAAAGLDAKIDCMYWTATQSVGADHMDIVRLNMKQNAFNLTGTGAAFVADRGVLDSATASNMFSTGFTPSTAGGVYQLNDCHLCSWDNTAGILTDLGWDNGGPSTVFGLNSSGVYVTLNQASLFGLPVGTTSTATGFALGQRTSSSSVEAYWADTHDTSVTSLGTQATSSTSLTSHPLSFGGVDGENYGAKQYSYASIGSHLISTEVTTYFNLIKALMRAVGN